ncbi:MAG: bifunctional phosphoribosyl-AMP cyclohydrolase/phosphoribosyl-ATP diphosphatase HisIE [Clostridiales bacterium]|nr:bifunctional phosphoribosyl-AMP cyclohydrolase/phosphoribosyl-ATP diphosphatase HisIE [Clostridiales bacterium]
MKIKQKDIIATMFLKDGTLVRDFHDHTPAGDIDALIGSFNDNGIDKIILYDLSDGEDEHGQNLEVIKRINTISELPVYAGGNINSMEDMKNILYSGCNKVILNSLKKNTAMFAREGSQRFGKERMALSVFNVDVFFKQKIALEENISEIIVLDERLAKNMSDVTDMPFSILLNGFAMEEICDILKSEDNVKGVSCRAFCTHPDHVPLLKKYLREQGISTDHLTSTMKWKDMLPDDRGLIPVVAQDYRTNEVLMLAWMNEEAYLKTLETGKMNYYSRERNQIYVKGDANGNYQYVKSLQIDYDHDSILARVSQIGSACVTGDHSSFFTELAMDEYRKRNLFEVLDNTYQKIKQRRDDPKNGSYTSYLFSKGMEGILKKLGEEALDLIITSNDDNLDNVKFQTADLVYHLMVFMAEVGIDWQQVLEELMVR